MERAGTAASYRHATIVVVLLSAFLLTACGGHKRARVRVPQPPAPAATSSASRTTAPPVTLPRDARPLYVETGLASWYGGPYHNRRAANGEIYNMHALTAAHLTLPLNSIVRVTNLQTGQSVVVRITDRGPFMGDRIIDLSAAAAKAIDIWRAGVARVKVEVMEAPAPINHGGRWAVQIGGFDKEGQARKVQDKLSRRYHTARVLAFSSPVGDWWVRVRVPGDDRRRAEEVAHNAPAPQDLVFLVRLD
jgi:rare lipoprotein A